MSPTPGDAYSVAVVTVDTAEFAEMRRGLLPEFRVTLADTESSIKDAVEDPGIRAMLLDLDSVGDAAAEGIEVLQEIRAIRDDIVIIALTKSRERNLPLHASQAGADEFVLSPVNYEELQAVLSRAVEKRAL